MITINWLALGVAAGASFLLGALWYSPLAFGKAWMEAVGLNDQQLKNPAGPMSASAVSCLLTALVIGTLLDAMAINTLAGGLGLGAILGVGLVASAMLSDYLFCGWSIKLWAIQAGYRAGYCLLIGAIIGGWPG